MKTLLPQFKYHPYPLETGFIITSNKECICCHQNRGYVYSGPVYAAEDYENDICPWCIEDGSAHLKLEASFTDVDGVGGGGEWDEVSEEIIEQVAYRTPGFSGWQQEKWWTHCNDAGMFLGRMGKIELQAIGPEAVAVIKDSTGLTGEKWEEFFENLDLENHSSAYLFQCPQCNCYGGYQDRL